MSRNSLSLVLFLAAAALPAAAQMNDTAKLLTELIHVNTGNPPGNEATLDSLLKTKFAPLGFEIDIIPTPDPKKAHFIARLKGDGARLSENAEAVMLLRVALVVEGE